MLNAYRIVLSLMVLLIVIVPKSSAATFNEDISLGTNYKIFGETDKVLLDESGVIELKWLSNIAKPAIVWRDQNGDRKAAVVAHDYSRNDDRLHQHWSVETYSPGDEANPSGLYTRFAIGWGEAKAKIKFSLASVEFSKGVDTTFNASMTQNSSMGFTTKSDTEAQVIIDRGNINSDARLKFNSLGITKWSVGLLGTNSDLIFKRVAGGGEKMRVTNSGIDVSGSMESDSVILASPNGTRWKITVNDSGNLTTTAL